MLGMGSHAVFRAGHNKDNASPPCTHTIKDCLLTHSFLMVALCRLLRETYEPEQLTPSSTLEAGPLGNALVEVIFWMSLVAGCLRQPI